MNILKNKFLVSIFALIFSAQIVHSQINITGKAISFAGDSLFLFTPTDFYTKTLRQISSTKVDKDGNFTFVFDSNKSMVVYINLPVFSAFLYVEPNKSYEIRIPKKQELSVEQKLNPFFEKELIQAYVITKDKKDLNYLISVYNKSINQFSRKLDYTNDINEKYKYLDTIKIISDTLANKLHNNYFQNYKFYNFNLIRYYAIQGTNKFFLDSVFAKTPVLLNIPAYSMLFKFKFENFINSDNDLLDLKVINQAIIDTDWTNLKAEIGRNINTNDEFNELLSIRALFDLYYSHPYMQQKIIDLFVKINQETTYPDVAFISQNILNKFTTIRINYKTPDFVLKNKRGKEVRLSDFEGRFVYLNFIFPQSSACIQQLPFLQKYNDNNIKDLEVVSIFVGDSLSQMHDFLKAHKEYKWTFLFAKYQSELLKKYNVISYPTYFLIKPDGTLALENTPSPIDNFEQAYNNAYKNWHKNKK